MNKKVNQRQSKAKSLGQTLTGILIGLILGAIIIAVLLWFLNQQRVPTEPQRAPQNTEVEIIIPNQAVLPETSGFSETMTSAVSSVEETVDGWLAEDSEPIHETEQDGSVMAPPLKRSPVDVPQSALAEKKPEVKKEVPASKPEQIKPEVKKEADPASKPSAAQILEHGSVEKAQAAAKPVPEVKKEASAKVNTERRAKIQAGAYTQVEQAETQRAKLALLGIRTQVEKGEVNGQTVHRVRTATLSGEEAAQVRQTLKQQGIDAITVGGQ